MTWNPETLEVVMWQRIRELRVCARMVERRSETFPRCQRRTARVDQAILGVYLTAGNSPRIGGALAPLSRGAPVSKNAVACLAADFESGSSAT